MECPFRLLFAYARPLTTNKSHANLSFCIKLPEENIDLNTTTTDYTIAQTFKFDLT